MEPQIGGTVTKEDISKICRTCFGKLKLAPIHRIHVDQIPVAQLLQTYVFIEVSPTDSLPQNICIKCVKLLHQIHVFRKRSQQNEAILMRKIKVECSGKDDRNLDSSEGPLNSEQDSDCATNEQICLVTVGPTASAIDLKTQFEHNVKNNAEDDHNSTDVCDPLQVCLKEEHNVKPKVEDNPLKSPNKSSNKQEAPRPKRKCPPNTPVKSANKITTHKLCPVCQEQVEYSKYKSHMRLHQNKPQRCKYCSKEFMWSCSLKRHLMLHTGQRPHVCEICNRGYIQKEELTNHMLTHNDELDETKPKKPYKRCNNKEKPREKHFICHICGSLFATNQYLKKHIQGKHIGSKPKKKNVLCNICGKSVTHASFRYHQATHTGEKPHVCTTCNRGFAFKGYLAIHQLTHTGERPHKCTQCSRSFSHVTALGRHVKIVHKRERPYKCSICGWEFSMSHSLRFHMNTHTGETPFRCRTCGRGFADPSTLRRHGLRKCVLNKDA